LEALDSKLVEEIQKRLLDEMSNFKNDTLSSKSVYVDPTLYYRPLDVNNRASNLSLTGHVNGTYESMTDEDKSKTIRMYVQWHDRHDIDLSGFVITSDNGVVKVGWNGRHELNGAVVYSGDNTGYSHDLNGEYLDITPSKLPTNAEWVISECRIYRGPKSFKSTTWKEPVKAGWMSINKPTHNSHWQGTNVKNAIALQSDSNSAYLLAYHVPTNGIIYLDLSMNGGQITSNDDAAKMRIFLERYIPDMDSSDISWKKINQGHVINILSHGSIVDDPTKAEIVFDENSTYEEVTKYLSV
jgi:hypothetical protein